MYDDKGSLFGGIPIDELNGILAWATAATTTVSELQDRITVLVALVKEEHAAANPSDKLDLIAIVMKCMDVKAQRQNVIGGAPVADLVTTIDKLAAEWVK